MKGATIAGIGGTLPAATPPLRGHSLSAIRRIANEMPAGFAASDDAFFRRATGASRCAAWLSSQQSL
jgi:hypothetical protein